MAIVYTNTDGAVGIADGGTPRIITVKAGSNISGGYFVNGSTLKGVVGSSASTYVAGDLVGYPISTQAGSRCIGIALADIASGTYGPVAMRGIFLVPTLSGTKIGSVDAGAKVCAGSAGTVMGLGSATGFQSTLEASTDGGNYAIGTALTAGGILSEFVAVSLNI